MRKEDPQITTRSGSKKFISYNNCGSRVFNILSLEQVEMEGLVCRSVSPKKTASKFSQKSWILAFTEPRFILSQVKLLIMFIIICTIFTLRCNFVESSNFYCIKSSFLIGFDYGSHSYLVRVIHLYISFRAFPDSPIIGLVPVHPSLSRSLIIRVALNPSITGIWQINERERLLQYP